MTSHPRKRGRLRCVWDPLEPLDRGLWAIGRARLPLGKEIRRRSPGPANLCVNGETLTRQLGLPHRLASVFFRSFRRRSLYKSTHVRRVGVLYLAPGVLPSALGGRPASEEVSQL